MLPQRVLRGLVGRFHFQRQIFRLQHNCWLTLDMFRESYTPDEGVLLWEAL